MTQWLYVPRDDVQMSPMEGLRFYADALRGDWSSIDGRSEKAGLNEYIDWAVTADTKATTEVEVLAQLRSCLGVYVIEEFFQPDYHDRRGIWAHHIDELIEAEYEALHPEG